MNKILFHEGGQPIQLDDLQLLQENSFSLFKALIDALSGQTPVFLIKRPGASVKVVSKDTTSYVVESGSIVVDGEVLSWPETDMQVKAWNAPVYACIRDTESDPRVFADGQTNNCRANKSVYLSLTKDGASKAYNIFELPIFPDLLGKVIGVSKSDKDWNQLEILGGMNGYSGEIYYKELDGVFFFNVNLTSDHEAWDKIGEKTVYGVCEINANPILSGEMPSLLSIPLNVKGNGLLAYLNLDKNYHFTLMLSGDSEKLTPKNLPLIARDKKAIIL